MTRALRGSTLSPAAWQGARRPGVTARKLCVVFLLMHYLELGLNLWQAVRVPQTDPNPIVILSCLALTGSGLGGVRERGELESIEEAGPGEQLVGGVVRVEAV